MELNKIDFTDSVGAKNITNCITDIPQDIIVSYATTILTIASGTKVYDALGNSWIVSSNITRDFSGVAPASNNKWIMVFEKNGNANHVYSVEAMFSQATQPSGAGVWFNTDNNEVKWSNDAVTWGDCSFPIGIISTDNNRVIQDVQVFNGIGFIGKKVFTLPGVKWLNPNGRNSDGTLRNTERVSTSVRISANEGTGDVELWLTDTTAQRITSGSYKYNESLNLFSLSNNPDEIRYVTKAGTLTLNSSNIIVGMQLNTTFHAVGWNDVVLPDKEQTLTNKIISRGSNKITAGAGFTATTTANITVDREMTLMITSSSTLSSYNILDPSSSLGFGTTLTIFASVSKQISFTSSLTGTTVTKTISPGIHHLYVGTGQAIGWVYNEFSFTDSNNVSYTYFL